MGRKSAGKKMRTEKLARAQRAGAQSAAGAAVKARARAARAGEEHREERGTRPRRRGDDDDDDDHGRHRSDLHEHSAEAGQPPQTLAARTAAVAGNAKNIHLPTKKKTASASRAVRPRGLVNLGNTCFFNSAMQNVARIAPLQRYFAADGPATQGHDVDPDMGGGASDLADKPEGPLTAALRIFMQDMWDPATSNHHSVINPKHLFYEVGRKYPRFKGRNQQDAHEVLRCIFDGIVDEENERLKADAQAPSQGSDADTDDDRDDDGDGDGDGEDHHENDKDVNNTESSNKNSSLSIPNRMPTDVAGQASAVSAPGTPVTVSTRSQAPASSDPPPSIISTCFTTGASPQMAEPLPRNIIEATVGGKLVSTVCCLECGFRSSTVEPFLDLSLPLVPREAPAPCASSVSKALPPQSNLSNSSATVLESPSVETTDARAIFVGPGPEMCQKRLDNTSGVAAAPRDTADSCDSEACLVNTAVTETDKVPTSGSAPSAIPPPPPPLPPRLKCNGRPAIEFSSASLRAELEEHMRQREAAVLVSVSDGDLLTDIDAPGTPSSPAVSTGASASLSHSPADRSDASDLEFEDEPLMVASDSVIVLGAPPDVTVEVQHSGFSDDEDGEPFAFPLFDDDEGEAPPRERPIGPERAPNVVASSQGDADPDTSVCSRLTSSSCQTGGILSSILGGLGYGVQAAPHGYKSIVGSLESFTSAEVLEGENAYGCEECTRREVARLTEERRLALGRTTKYDIASSVPGHGSECGASSCCMESGADKTASCSLDNALRPVLHASDQLQDRMPSSQIVGARSHTHELLSSSPVTSRESSVGGRSELDSCSARSEDSDKEDDERLRKMPEVKIRTIRSRAEKLFLIKDAPRALIIHLKRFTQAGFRGGLRKISGHVDFPMELDLSPFVESTHHQGSSLTAVSPTTVNPISLPSIDSKSEGLGRHKNTVANRKAVKDEFIYHLTGVCVHGGSLHGGHYTAYVREGVDRDRSGGWFHCSDSSVTRVTEEEVLASEAFLLFYERFHI